MASSHLIRLGKIKGKNSILFAQKHNKRTLQSERGAEANIDATRTYLNYGLHGLDTPEEIAIHANVQIAKAGIVSLRKDAVMGVEVIFSLPINRHQQDTKPFFLACYEWLKITFNGELLSFDVHLDEAAPHAHAIILPLVNGRMQGRDLVGNKGNLMRLINLFYLQVASHFGLSRKETKRLNISDKETLAREVVRCLRGDSVLNSKVWPIFRDLIFKDPLPYAQTLSIQLPAKVSHRHFVDIARSRGKGTLIK